MKALFRIQFISLLTGTLLITSLSSCAHIYTKNTLKSSAEHSSPWKDRLDSAFANQSTIVVKRYESPGGIYLFEDYSIDESSIKGNLVLDQKFNDIELLEDSNFARRYIPKEIRDDFFNSTIIVVTDIPQLQPGNTELPLKEIVQVETYTFDKKKSTKNTVSNILGGFCLANFSLFVIARLIYELDVSK